MGLTIMTIHQLSIFIENRSGTLIKVLDALKEAHIQIIASTIADTADYGIYRLICSEPMRACDELKRAGVAVALSEVFVIAIDNEPGRAADAVKAFSQADIDITYMYSFLNENRGLLIFRTNDNERAQQIITANNMQIISEEALQNLV